MSENKKKQDITKQNENTITTENTEVTPQAEPQEPNTEVIDSTLSDEAAQQISELKKELENTKNTLLRTAAEYDNFRKRTAKEKDAAFGNGIAHAAEKLLVVLDTLSLAAAAETQDAEYKKGVTLTLEKANDAFSLLDIKEIDALGQIFDPQTMAAVMQQPAKEDEKPDQVVQVFQKGYTLGDRVIRHATVVVATN